MVYGLGWWYFRGLGFGREPGRREGSFRQQGGGGREGGEGGLGGCKPKCCLPEPIDASLSLQPSAAAAYIPALLLPGTY